MQWICSALTGFNIGHDFHGFNSVLFSSGIYLNRHWHLQNNNDKKENILFFSLIIFCFALIWNLLKSIWVFMINSFYLSQILFMKHLKVHNLYKMILLTFLFKPEELRYLISVSQCHLKHTEDYFFISPKCTKRFALALAMLSGWKSFSLFSFVDRK